MRDRLPWVFGCSGELEGFGSMEGCAEANFADFFRMNLRQYECQRKPWQPLRNGG